MRTSLNRFIQIATILLGIAIPSAAAPTSGPAGNFITNISTNVSVQVFKASSGTVSSQFYLPFLTAGQCATVSASGQVIGIACGSGASSVAVTTGNTSGFNSVVSSPTSVVNFDSSTFNLALKGAATVYILPNPSSVTLQGNNLSATYLTNSSATATYLQLSSATATYLQNSSATATYFNLNNVLSVAHGGTGTPSPGLIAGTNITSITGSWPNQTINASGGSGGGSGNLTNNANQYSTVYYSASGSSNTLSGLSPGTTNQGLLSGGSGAAPFWNQVILGTSTLQSGATFFVSSGTATNLTAGTSASNSTFTIIGANQNWLFAPGATLAGTGGTGTLYIKGSNSFSPTQFRLSYWPTNTGQQAGIYFSNNDPKINFESTSGVTIASMTSTGGLVVSSLTATSLTSGQCVQTGTGGLLTGTGSACGSGSGSGYAVAPATVPFNLAQGVTGTTFTFTGPAQSSITYGVSMGSATLTGSGNIALTENGITGQVVLSTAGTGVTVGHCAQFGSSMTVVDAGAACGTGSGSGSGSGTIGVTAQYQVPFMSLVSSNVITSSANFTNNGTTITMVGIQTITETNFSSETATGAMFNYTSSSMTVSSLTVSGTSFGVNTLQYSWPSSQSIGVLNNSGSGSLSWAPASGGGASTLAVTTGTSAGFTGTPTSSPTAVMLFDSATHAGALQGSSTYFLTLLPSSVTLQGNAISLSALSSSMTSVGIATGTLRTLADTKVNIASITATIPITFSAAGVIATQPISLSSGVTGTLPTANMVSTVAFISSSQTWTAQQLFNSPSPSTVTYGLNVGSITTGGIFDSSSPIKTMDYTMTKADMVILSSVTFTASSATLTLPTGNDGQTVFIWKVDSDSVPVVIKTQGSDTIAFSTANFRLRAQGQGVELTYNNSLSVWLPQGGLIAPIPYIGGHCANDPNSGTTVATSSNVYFNAEYVPAPAVVYGIRFEVTTANGNMVVALYDSTGVNATPGTLLSSSTLTAVPTGGSTWGSINFQKPVLVMPGTYYLAMAIDNATASINRCGLSSGIGSYLQTQANTMAMPTIANTSTVAGTRVFSMIGLVYGGTTQ